MADERHLARVPNSTDVATLGNNLAKALLNRHILPVHSSVLIQCGHFPLIYDRQRSTFLPAVPQESTKTFDPLPHRTFDAIGVFPRFSWDLGNAIAQALQSVDLSCSFTTIVNDWQLVKSVDRLLATRLRQKFYAETPFPLFPYYELTHPSPSLGFISEYLLRRRLERRLKRLVSTEPISRLIWKDRGSGSPGNLFLNVEEGDKLLLRDGKSDCAGEVAELMLMASSLGHNVLINIYPLACLEPVHHGISMAFELESAGLQSSIAVQIGLSCSGETSSEELISKGVRTTIQAPNRSSRSLL